MTGFSTRSGGAALWARILSLRHRRMCPTRRVTTKTMHRRVTVNLPGAWLGSVTATSTSSGGRTSPRALPRSSQEISRLLRATSVRAMQRSRRMRRSRRDHGRHDTRATMRRSLRSGGEVVRLVHREPTSRPRRVVLLCDVSGSMEPYARALLRFLHVAVAGQGRVEAFAVGHPADPAHPPAVVAGSRCRLAPGHRAGVGLVGRNPARGGNRYLQ